VVAGREDDDHEATRIHQRKVPSESQAGQQIQLHNVAIWENEEVYWKAYDKSVTPMKTKLEQLGVEMVPALYSVAFEY